MAKQAKQSYERAFIDYPEDRTLLRSEFNKMFSGKAFEKSVTRATEILEGPQPKKTRKTAAAASKKRRGRADG
jgi:hypothetical protein